MRARPEPGRARPPRASRARGHVLKDRPCALPTSTSSCRTTASRCGRPRRGTPRGCWWSAPTARSSDRSVRDLPDLLRPGDALVLQRHPGDRRAAERACAARRRLDGRGRGDAAPAPLALALDGLRRPGKRLAVGDRIALRRGERPRLRCSARSTPTVVGQGRGRRGDAGLRPRRARPRRRHRRRTAPCRCRPTSPAARAEDERDLADYQTVYAREDGSVAAPTAGLHFTPELMAALQARGVALHFVTLHVGAGTFLPVKTEDIAEHRMHAECGRGVRRDRRRAERGARRAAGGSSRSAPPRCGCWRARRTRTGAIRPFDGETSIFITPGYRFRTADGLMTNFHLPRSTLFMLVRAFAGLETMRAAYAHAIAAGYRFYSYGDACLLWRAGLMARLPLPHRRRATARRAPACSRRRAARSARRPSCRSAPPARSRR